MPGTLGWACTHAHQRYGNITGIRPSHRFQISWVTQFHVELSTGQHAGWQLFLYGRYVSPATAADLSRKPCHSAEHESVNPTKTSVRNRCLGIVPSICIASGPCHRVTPTTPRGGEFLRGAFPSRHGSYSSDRNGSINKRPSIARVR